MEYIKTVFVSCLISICFFNSPLKAQEAFLSSGEWVKLSFPGSGIYKITYSDLINYGFEVSNLNPKNIHLYSVQGTEIPVKNGSIKSSADELSIYIEGEADGKFDANDYIIIYKKGVQGVHFNGNRFAHFINQYSNTSFAILGYNGLVGKRMNVNVKPNLTSPKNIQTNWNVRYHDSNLVNPLHMGRMWLGEKLGNESLTRSFEEKNVNASDTGILYYRTAAALQDDTGSLIVKVNQVNTRDKLRVIYPKDEAAYTYLRSIRIPNLSSTTNIQLVLNRKNTQSSAYLDYYELQYPSALEFTENQFYINSSALYSGNLNGAWFDFSQSDNRYSFINVTNDTAPSMLYSEINAGKTRFAIAANESFTQAIGFIKDNLPAPNLAERLTNKNILAAADDANLIIITHPDFINQANELAKYRRMNDKLSVAVVTPQEIYNVFSGGQQDLMALRNYLRFKYEKTISTPNQLKYVLLLGAASYDFKDVIPNNTNFIPIYHSTGEIYPSAFCLDDFLGYFEMGKGDPEVDKNKLIVTIGRIPARKASDANGVIEKLKMYDGPTSLGAWRNKLSFVCDDVDDSWESEFTNESEKYTDDIKNKHPHIKFNKIYADAYKQSTNGNNEKYPDVSNSIIDAFEKGSLLINYQGHGGEKGWAQESIFDIPMVNNLTNKKNMPVLFTATCEFSRYDNPELQSAGELSLLNPNGGAIALMTTTRLVYVAGNSLINEAFWTKYGFPEPNEPIPTLGELYAKMKNRPNPTSEDKKFALLGDPSMTLAFPKHLIYVDSINGESIIEYRDTVKAFSVVRLKGHINERLKGLMADFNGKMEVEILDKPIKKVTLNNDKVGGNIPFELENSIIYKGSVSVVDGKFELMFSVPKDISYEFGEGRAMFYADNGVTDAAGSWIFNIGGSQSINDIDSVGPTVKAYMQDTFFVDGTSILENAAFVGSVFDKSGLNATGSGIGRDMMLILDPGTENEKVFMVNDYFNYDNNSFQKGMIKFDFSNLTPGSHEIECKVWDIYNNSGSDRVQFEVVPGRHLELLEHTIFPNPALITEPLSLKLRHNLAGEDLIITTEIFDVMGRRVTKSEINELFANSQFSIPLFNSDTDNLPRLLSGVYIYKIKVTTADGLSEIVGGKFILR